MKLERWALIAEIISAIAIVASLIFVGVQVRQAANVTSLNTRAVEGQVYQDLVAQITNLNYARVGNKQFADVFARYAAGQDLLDAGEVQQMNAYAATIFRIGDVAYQQFRNGLIDEESLQSVLNPVTLSFDYALSRRMWTFLSPGLTEEYVRYMQEITDLCARFRNEGFDCNE
jgi:hypothetical protein